MADRDFGGIVKTIGGKVRLVAVQLLVQSAAVTIIKVPELVAITHPLVASAVRDSAGRYTVTLRNPYRRLLGWSVDYAAVETNVDLYAQMSAAGSAIVTNLGTANAGAFTVALKTGVTDTDPSASGGVISCQLTFEDSGAFNA